MVLRVLNWGRGAHVFLVFCQMWMVAAKNCGNLSGAQLPKAFVPVNGVLLCCVDLNCNTTATRTATQPGLLFVCVFFSITVRILFLYVWPRAYEGAID